MADFKTQYVRETARVKKAASDVRHAPSHPVEKDIFSTFREHAREDFRTFTPSKKSAAKKG
ncbi:MAG TPA: hypothetical protein VMT54_20080 [Candidatus Cybelea sp.]|nr:hypothetical protein [Candidatus Cybelea sp.]